MINKLIVQSLLRKQENNPAINILSVTPSGGKDFLLSTDVGVFNYNALTATFKHMGMSVNTDEPKYPEDVVMEVESEPISEDLPQLEPELEEMAETQVQEPTFCEIVKEIPKPEVIKPEVVKPEVIKEKPKAKEDSFMEKVAKKITGKRGRPKKK